MQLGAVGLGTREVIMSKRVALLGLLVVLTLWSISSPAEAWWRGGGWYGGWGGWGGGYYGVPYYPRYYGGYYRAPYYGGYYGGYGGYYRAPYYGGYYGYGRRYGWGW